MKSKVNTWDTIFYPTDWQKIIPSIGKDTEQLIVMTSISAPHSLALPSKVEHIHDPITPLSVY